MSGDMPDLPEEPSEDDLPGIRKHLKSVVAQNKVLRETGSSVAEELAGLKRKMAFDEAGVPTDSWGRLLREKYDGDADPEVIKQMVAEYGFQIEQPTAQPSAPQPQAEQVDPLALEREALAGMSQVRSQFAQPPAEQSSALVEALSKVEPGDRSTMLKLLQEANVLTTSD